MNVNDMWKLAMVALTGVLSACGGGDAEGPAGGGRTGGVACPTDHCGKASFLRAVPSADNVKIGFASAQTGRGLRAGAGRASNALETVSPAFSETAAYVDAINADIAAIFDDLEAIAGTAPEIETDTSHEWREGDGALEEVLHIDTADERSFTLAYGVGEPGFEMSPEDAVLTAEVQVGDDGNKASFTIDIDLDAWTAADPETAAGGKIEIRAMPFAGGELELWYDFVDVTVGGDSPESSQTTYWVFGEETDGALEYLADAGDVQATAYVRWSADGGRYDHHVAYDDPEHGLVDEIATSCWDASTAETFDAIAVLDQDLAFDAELDGEETDCLFGPVADHPNPSEDFDDLPGEGEWQALEDAAIQYCEENPDDC